MSTTKRLPLLILFPLFSAFGQAPDCSFSTQFSAAGNGQSVSNVSSASGPACPLWMVTVTAEGFSALQLHLQGAPDNAGSPGSWADFGAPLVACNGGTCAAPGANPLTSTTDSFMVARQYASWVRVVLDNTTGSGTVRVRANGYKANSSVAGASGGSGGGCHGDPTGVFFADGSGNCTTDVADGFTWDSMSGTLGVYRFISAQSDLKLRAPGAGPILGPQINMLHISGAVEVLGEDAIGADRLGGDATLRGGNGGPNAVGGNATVAGGDGDTAANGGDVILRGGGTGSGSTGSVKIRTPGTSGTSDALLDPSAITSPRTFSFQDQSGVLALRLVATASLNFPSINDGGTADLTFTLTGAKTGDNVAPALPTVVTAQAGVTCTMAVSAADTILVRCLNLSGGAVDLGSATYGAAVLR